MRFALLFALLSLHVACAFSQAPSCHQQGRVRVFYDTEGQHAVDPGDRNGDQVPDQVEDILTQTLAAQTLFVEVLQFPDPFQTERFREARFLDIHLRHRDVLKSNGVAYDELQRFKRPQDPEGTLSLCFNVATSVRANANLTPAHEFFHIVQNSITYFKNSWFTEGTARWSESGLELGALGAVVPLPAWPLSDEQAAGIFTASYEASQRFWNPLAARVDPQEALPASPALSRLQAMTYADGTPVLKDLRFTAWSFIREVLLELGRIDDTAFRDLGYDRWSEENQRSPKNNAFILDAVTRVVGKREEK